MFFFMIQSVYDGDEMFWYKISMLMVEVILKDYENRKGQRIVSGQFYKIQCFLFKIGIMRIQDDNYRIRNFLIIKLKFL